MGSWEGFLKQSLSLNKERQGKAEGKEINGFGELRGSRQTWEGQKLSLTGHKVTTDLRQYSQVQTLKLFNRNLTTMAQPHLTDEETEEVKVPEKVAVPELEPRVFSSKLHCTQGP